MGTMTKLRENTGVVLWILVIAFGVIWVLQDSGGLDFVGLSAGSNIIVVDGEPITVEEYTRAVDAQVQRYQEQTGESMPPQMLERERERVFEALVEDRLMEREMNRLGITVTDEEVYQLVRGEDPHPMILAYFGDGEGNVNEALLESFINNPDARQDWVQIEEFLRQERRREKLQNLIAATIRVTDKDVEDAHRRRNRAARVEWVGQRYAEIPDDQVEVTDRDLRQYYNDNREDFRRERTYTVEYASVSKMPSEQDSLLIAQEMERLSRQFAQAEDDSVFLERHGSVRSYSSNWFTPDELEPDLASEVFDDPQEGEIVGPVFAGGNAHLVKIQEVRQAENPFIRARHILIRSEEEGGDAEDRLREIREQIEGGADFEEMARQHSQDNTASIGGDLGWFGRGRMVAPFEEAAFDASVGEIVGPVRTTFGYHLIQVTDRADQEIRMADYAQPVAADIGTLSAIQERLEDLRYYADEGGDFETEAERLGIDVESVQVEEGQTVIPGIGESRALARFLEGANRGDISETIELDDAFVVAHVSEVQRAGYRPFDEVSNEIRPRVVLEKKRQATAERMREAAEGNDLQAMASELGTEVRTEERVTFQSQVISGLGREPKFAGTAFGLSEGETSRVVEGNNGAFVLRVVDVQEPPDLPEGQRQRLRAELENERRNEVMNQWLASAREEAEVQDNRQRFLQY